MAEKPKSSSKPIVDVAHPNKSAPAQNSKSVIVGNRPMLKDPMVVDQEDLEIAATEENKPESTITEIAAIAAADKPAKTEDKPADDKDAKTEREKEEPKPEPADPDKFESSAADEVKNYETDSKEDKDTAPENQLDIDASKDAEHEAAVQKLSESKKYFLPINAVEQRKSKQFVILGIVVSVILALAWVDIALDASLIKIPGVKPVTHLFSN